MKKVLSAVLILLMVLSLTACGCKHEWAEADCTAPKTCTLCGETEGEPLAHTWAEASCAAPKTCTVCAATEGSALEHTWAEATCTAPKTCTVCAATEGEALPHTLVLQEMTDTVRTDSCSVCGETVTSDVTDLSAEAMELVASKWDAQKIYNGLDYAPVTDPISFEFTADGTVISNLPDNPGEGVYSFDHYNEFLGMFRFVAEINGATYDVAFQTVAPDELQWWYRDRYAALICQRQ